ncbi:hypothetical protein GCM10011329_18450 [Stakelama pacifica]|nr:hypothetical protein GCM10011329_18450 [Stakelama pacifica]
MKHGFAPAFGKARNRRQFVANPGGKDHPACLKPTAILCDRDETARSAFDAGDVPANDLGRRIRKKLARCIAHDGMGLSPVLTKKAVCGMRKAIARRSGIDQQNALPCAGKLHCR